METQELGKTAGAKEVQVPEWEHVAAKDVVPNASQFIWRGLLDKVIPPHRKYLGLRRKWFLGALLAGFLVALALIVGLAVGLRRPKYQNLPLPTKGGQFTGELTYFETGLGACGWTTTSADKIVSLSHFLFDASGSTSSNGGNSNANPLCGRMIRAKRFNQEAGEMRSVDLKVVDRCTGCQPNDLDTTTSAFEELAAIADGRVDVTWAWL